MRIPQPVRAKLEAQSYWQFATINEDGSPTATPVWADVDGDHVLVNTVVGRVKERNVRRDPRVAMAMVVLEHPATWVEIQGRVVEFVEGEEADASINRLSYKYLGVESYVGRAPEERRVILRIEPTAIHSRTEGGDAADVDR